MKLFQPIKDYVYQDVNMLPAYSAVGFRSKQCAVLCSSFIGCEVCGHGKVAVFVMSGHSCFLYSRRRQ